VEGVDTLERAGLENSLREWPKLHNHVKSRSFSLSRPKETRCLIQRATAVKSLRAEDEVDKVGLTRKYLGQHFVQK